jgi:hypothetical protein
MGELKKVTRTVPEGEHAAGEDVWIRWGPSGYGHGITCVGYDDEVGVDVNGDGKITNDLDLNGDGEVTLADWERGAYIVVNSWGQNWSKDGRIYLLYSAMIDPSWKRGNFLGRIEVKRHQPRRTFRFKMACNDRTDLRLSIGISGEVEAREPEHEIFPEAFNGWPLFEGGHAGHVPLAGPDDETPLEAGVDLTALFEKLGPDEDGRGRFFLKISRAEGSAAQGELLEGGIRSYGVDGEFLQEIPIGLVDGRFGDATFESECPVEGLPRTSSHGK